MRMVQVGGRIKSAAIGLNDFCESGDLDNHFSNIRRKPPLELLKAFFPSSSVRIKNLLNGVGFYRPLLKTDQGMGGNFLPFWIDGNLHKTDLSSRMIIEEENLAIPEEWYDHQQEVVEQVQREFFVGNYQIVYQILDNLASRKAGKGRTPFFLLRPARMDKSIIFGSDICYKVNGLVNKFLQFICEEAKQLEIQQTGKCREANIIYCQPDVYISSEGKIVIEKINIPDVSMFLESFKHPYSEILPDIQKIISKLGDAVLSSFQKSISLNRSVYIVTRDEVINKQEDLLEIGEIKKMKEGLNRLGYKVDIISVNNIDNVLVDSAVILMNLNYRESGCGKLIDRHSVGEISCFPNPFVQMVAQKSIGLKKIFIPESVQNNFLSLISSQPKSEKGLIDVKRRIEKHLIQYGIFGDILHIDTGVEIIPVFRHLIHSWRQVVLRIKKNGCSGISIIEIPVELYRSLLQSSTGVRMHVFRFMFVN